MNKIKVTIISGGPSSEHDVSIKTGQMIAENLSESKYEIALVKISKENGWTFGDETIEYNLAEAINQLTERKFDLAFIALHGVFGEDGHIQAILDSIKLPYTGSGMLASAMAMDKNISNIVYTTVGMPVPEYQVLSDIGDKINISVPFVVKPLEGGSSIGTSIVKDVAGIDSALKSAFAESNKIMIQRFISGREFTCAILDDINSDPIALSPIEIIPKVSSFFDYRAKYEDKGSDEVVNPEIGEEKLNIIKELALKAHKALGCYGMSRTDFMEEVGNFYIIETNTIPGMTQNSLLPKSAKGSGIEFAQVLELIAKSALKKKD